MPGLGLALKALGALALVGGFFGVIYFGERLPWAAANRLLPVFAYLPATCLIYYGYRLSLRSVEAARSADTRSPVLYLRPFEQDGRNNFNPPGLVAQFLGLEPVALLRWLGPLGNVHPIRLLRLLWSRASDHSEEQLGAHLREVGPFVAIGKPGERLPLGGAARVYVGDDQWQETILGLLRSAAVVVLQPAESEPVWWEVRQTFQHVAPERVLYDLLPLRDHQWRYERFRLRFEQETGLPLPRGLNGRSFLFFQEGRGVLVPAIPRPHAVWPLAGCALDFARTLRPFHATRTGESRRAIPPRWEPGFLRRVVSAAGAMALWTVLLGGVYFLGSWSVLRFRLHSQADRLVADFRHGPARVLAQGPPELPYRLALPTLWQVARDLPGLPAGARAWKLSDLAVLSLVTQAIPPGAPAPSRETILQNAEAKIRETAPSLQEVSRSVERIGGREWLLARLRFHTGGGFWTEEAQKRGLLWIADAQMAGTIAISSSEDAVALVSLDIAAPVAEKLAPMTADVLSNFQLEMPAEIARREAEAAKQKWLATALEEARSLRVALASDGPPTARVGEISGQPIVLRLKPAWTPCATNGFTCEHLGHSIRFQVKFIARDTAPRLPPVGGVNALEEIFASSQAAKALPVSDQQHFRQVSMGGLTWLEAHGSVPDKERRSFSIARYLITEEGVFEVTAFGPADLEPEYAEAIEEAFQGFAQAPRMSAPPSSSGKSAKPAPAPSSRGRKRAG